MRTWPPSWNSWPPAKRPAAAWALAATHLQWASDISPDRADRERRLLTAALHLTLAVESRGLALREAVEAAAPSPLRSCVLGTMAFASGQLGEAERRFSQALAQAQDDPDSQPLAALIANRLAGTYTLLGDGREGRSLSGGRRWTAGCLDAAAASQTRTLVAIGASQVSGPQAGLAELAGTWTPTRPGSGRWTSTPWRSAGCFRLLAGDPGRAVSDLSGSLGLVRRGATLTLGAARLLLPGAGPVPGRRVGRRAAHRRAGVLRRRDPLPPVRAAAAAPGRGLRAGQPRRGGGSRTARPAGRGGRGQRGLRAGTGVRGDGPGAGLPGRRRLPGHGRRAGTLAGRRGPGRPQPGLRRCCGGRCWPRAWSDPGSWSAAAAVLAQLRADSGQVSYMRPGPGLAGRMAGRAARRTGRGAGPSTSAAKTPPASAARSTTPGCCWPTAGCCAAPASGGWPSSGCARPARFTTRCAPSRSSPGPKRNSPPATCPAPRPRSSLC